MQKKLSWCVGKFAYMHGSSAPIHFMELRDFCLDPSLDMSLLIALRTLRVTQSEDPIERQLHDWRDRLAVKEVGELAIELLRARADISDVLEYYPRVGFVYEYLKMLRERQTSESFNFTAIGPEELRSSFEMLHVIDDYEFEYFAEDRVGAVQNDGSALTIFNHNQAVRQETEPAFAWKDLIGCLPTPAIVSLRVADTSEGTMRTSIHGRAMQLPQLDEAIETLLSQDGNWRFKYLGRFDEKFFLPPAQNVGLLLGYNAGTSLQLDGFETEIIPAERRRSRYS